MMNNLVSLNNVGLKYPIYDVSSQSLKKTLMSIAHKNIIPENERVIVVEALRNITFELQLGDRLGLVGHNGAGKSSLLRVLAGIYQPTSGMISVIGKSVPLLDIGLGMDDMSTGFQNIRLRCLLLGMKESEISQKSEEIADFSELGPYLHLPLRTYSTGMKVRLAFSVATAVESEILLLDEVLAVGDYRFQQKAKRRLETLHERSEIVVMANHSAESIRASCNKVIWLEKGEMRAFGSTEKVMSSYQSQ